MYGGYAPRMSESTHLGGCHCGNVRYEVKIDLEKPVITCNCSMCGRSGTMLAFVPADAFTLQRGEDSLTEYRFNKKVIAHLFCNKCGIKPFARGERPDGTKTVAVNVRCLDDVDLGTLEVTAFDGRSK
jgi:hypothetical protein